MSLLKLVHEGRINYAWGAAWRSASDS